MARLQQTQRKRVGSVPRFPVDVVAAIAAEAEKEKMKARTEVAHEVRIAREAEAEMDLHVKKAAEKAAKFEQKHPSQNSEINWAILQ
ncbi:hypothetical protein AgCh_034351 [Apium graveolens]